jgi:hypothetical protein
MQEALQYAPAGAEAVYVGKRGGKASFKQPDIDQLLVQYVQQVRLQNMSWWCSACSRSDYTICCLRSTCNS